MHRFLVTVFLCLILFATAVVGATPGEKSQPRLQFNRDIRPILSQNCFFCHGFDKEKREAGLRLDVREAALEAGAVVPGSPEESLLIERITTSDKDDMMPPHDSAYELTGAEKSTLRRWIEEGAVYEDHWFYIPVVRPELPPGEGHPVDRFLAARWKSEKIETTSSADPRTVARRLCFDLTGLPPEPGVVEWFEEDPSAERFTEMVDKLMGSSAYGEHMAVGWLDLVRWADTTGIASDEPFDSQAYRTYVIRAFNTNKRFDDFTIEQLAGDLLDKPTDETLVASGYNRLLRTNSEAGVIEEEAIYAMKADHVRTLGGVWLGSTTECAECHDHKYDPFSQKDYYSMAAFFDDLQEVGIYSPGDHRYPLHYVYPNRDVRSQAVGAEAALVSATAQLLEKDAELDAGQAAWEEAQKETAKGEGEFVWLPALLPGAGVEIGSEGDAYTMVEKEGRPARRQKAVADEGVRHVLAEPITGVFKHDTVKSCHLYVDVYLDPDDPPEAIALQQVQGGYGRMGWRPDIYGTLYWGPEGSLKDAPWVHEPKYKRVGDLPAAGGWVRLEIDMKKGGFKMIDGAYRHNGMAWAQSGGTVYWGDTGYTSLTGEANKLELATAVFREYADRPVLRDTYNDKDRLIYKAIKKPPTKRSADEVAIIRRAYRQNVLSEAQARVYAAERQVYRLRRLAVPALVSKSVEPRVTRLLNRGDFRDKKGPVVVPAIPEFLGSVAPGRRANRLDLARWIVSRDNPLTARVFVNRLWAQFYGRGISETLEDLGGQGKWPSHPELLDWMATEFMESGWNVKAVVKLMVTAGAYRFDSRPTEVQLESDPGNRLHARQARFRLRAEAVRDNALAVSGLLRHGDVLGESIFPYQPDTYWDGTNKVMLGSRFLDYKASGTGRQHQRSVYTFWKRIGTHPTLLAFDAPSRQICTASRAVTNTPGQALVLLNDPIFVEAARALAGRIGQGAPGERLERAFRFALNRSPSAEETVFLTEFYKTQYAHFSSHTADAEKLLTVGVAPRAGGVDPVEYAAWTAVCRVVLNLHETITRS